MCRGFLEPASLPGALSSHCTCPALATAPRGPVPLCEDTVGSSLGGAELMDFEKRSHGSTRPHPEAPERRLWDKPPSPPPAASTRASPFLPEATEVGSPGTALFTFSFSRLAKHTQGSHAAAPSRATFLTTGTCLAREPLWAQPSAGGHPARVRTRRLYVGPPQTRAQSVCQKPCPFLLVRAGTRGACVCFDEKFPHGCPKSTYDCDLTIAIRVPAVLRGPDPLGSTVFLIPALRMLLGTRGFGSHFPSA